MVANDNPALEEIQNASARADFGLLTRAYLLVDTLRQNAFHLLRQSSPRLIYKY